jgi:agmatine deiminase
MTSPREAGYRMPAEWAPHAATWVAWPSHADLWKENLPAVRRAFTSLVQAIAEGEVAEVLVPDAENERLARAAFGALGENRVRFHRVPFGDIWLRDTAPVYVASQLGSHLATPSASGDGRLATVRFVFNGWGGKYVLDDDDRVAERVAAISGEPAFTRPFVLEGGAVEVDGEGTVLTTRQCLLNPNRNPNLSEAQIEQAVLDSLGGEKLLWVGDGLLNDHTDGHVDTIARFVHPGVVLAMEPRSADDPNREALAALIRGLESLTDAKGRRLEVVRIPSPGLVRDDAHEIMPASYVNFYIANASVVVPTYGSPFDDEAVQRIAALFPGRTTRGVNAKALLAGGGAFHCITQQKPQAEHATQHAPEH